MKLKVYLIEQDAIVPIWAHSDDSGMDLFSYQEDTTINPGQSMLVRTGIAIQLPENTEGQIRSKSGLAANHGIIVLNSPGTIDRGYTGEIKVILFNQSKKPYLVKQSQKIAQLVIVPVLHPYIEVVKKRIQVTTSRGDKGFGSTGV